MAHSSPGAICIRMLDFAQPQVEPQLARVIPDLWSAVKRRSRFCKIPYSSAAAAALTLSDSMRPRSGSATSCVARGGDARAQAPALGAEDEHDAPAVVGLQVAASRALGRRAVAPAAGVLGRRPRKSATLRTRAIAQVLDRARRRLARPPA